MANYIEPWRAPDQIVEEARKRAPATVGLGISGGVIGALFGGPIGAFLGFVVGGFLGVNIDQDQRIG